MQSLLQQQSYNKYWQFLLNAGSTHLPLTPLHVLLSVAMSAVKFLINIAYSVDPTPWRASLK